MIIRTSNQSNVGGRHNSCLGFTLVELLVVIAILGILMSLVLSSVGSAKRKAKDINCVSNLKQYGIALQDFLSTSHEYPLEFNFEYSKGQFSNHKTTWIDTIYEAGLGENLKATICPRAERPSDFPEGRHFTSYGYNSEGIVARPEDFSIGLGRVVDPESRARPVRESEVSNPSNMIVFADGVRGRGENLSDGQVQIGMDWRLNGDKSTFRRTLQRHDKKLNFVFGDGHVESRDVLRAFDDRNRQSRSSWSRDGLPHLERK